MVTEDDSDEEACLSRRENPEGEQPVIPPIVVMGVSGCGKTTLGQALARALGRTFIEGDDLHPDANLRKMAQGIPLTDEDRRPFLINVAEALVRHADGGAVAACSALKKSYRDLIRERAGPVLFVLPTVSRNELVKRLASRRGHFMPVSLLDDQLATLEVPDDSEMAIVLDGETSVSDQVAATLEALSRRG